MWKAIPCLDAGILPDASSRVAPGVEVVVVTDLGRAGNFYFVALAVESRIPR